MKRQSIPRSKRGSLLIVAMVLCVAIGVSLLAYMRLGEANMRLSNRALYNNAAINLAETGLEQAMWSINKMVAGGSPWTSANGWSTVDADEAYGKWTGYTYDQNSTGIVRVYVLHWEGLSAPKIVARSTITLTGLYQNSTIEKWIEVDLRKRSKFANGLVARNDLTFSGNNASVDSWNSLPSSGIETKYSAAVRNDKGTAGSISVGVDAVLVKQADVWGFVATGGVSPTVGTQGSVLGHDSTTSPVDPNRVSTDFTASLDPVSNPSGKTAARASSLGAVSSDLALPADTDVADADGKYYYTATSISLTNKTLSAGTATRPSKNVVITVSGGVSIGGGSGMILVNTGSQLALYVAGDVDIAGNGVSNGTPTYHSGNPDALTDSVAQRPINFQIYGTAADADNNAATNSQTIKIAGNGTLSGVIYAPNALVKVNGNGEVCGSVVAGNIEMTGNAAFHYDESLASEDSGAPFGITAWKELTTAASRNAYSSKLSF
jgi:hypothetical protein